MSYGTFVGARGKYGEWKVWAPMSLNTSSDGCTELCFTNNSGELNNEFQKGRFSIQWRARHLRYPQMAAGAGL